MVMQRALTVEDFLALPETKPGLEFFNGQVIQKPVTNADHIRIVWRLSAAFFAYAATHGGSGGPEGSVALQDGLETDVLLPDFAFWAEGVALGDYPLNPPTLAVEVRSPSQSMAAQREKCEIYVRRGVGEAWLIDPATEQLEVIHPGSTWQLFAGGNTVVESSSLPGFAMALSAIFA
ncbi:MAG: Uma2 family endonuclease [bacterium]